jgi:putative tricarboxylic transport membrane protein|tara:strand:- start:3574 stop:5601 length:2028 start_codon:yes stop_codon:yes gene_type:complete
MVFEAFLESIALIFQWQVMGYFALGCIIGILLGAVPGMGGAIGLVLLLPFTFAMEPIAAFALLLASWASTSTSGAITSVLLGVPATAASQATVLDGYPMAKRGEAARALGASFTASAIGGFFGALALGISLPLILPVILAFESPEQFMLGMLGLAMVGSLAGQSVAKGIVAAAFGLLLAMIGLPESAGVPRYTFDTLYMMDSLPLIPVLLGLFALPEVMELAIKNISIARSGKDEDTTDGLMTGVRDAFTNIWLVIRCSVIGTYIGMLPGLGASIVGWVTYAHAKQSVKDDSQFGQGDVRGLLAPEAANNALRGGALIPTLTLGIPGSVGTAILMGALIMHGLRPGPSMLTDELPITFSFVWMIAMASILATLILLKTVNWVAKVALMPGHLVVPGVLLFVFMGAWLGNADLGSWITCVVFGLLGFFMKRGGWPRPPVILALVLGPILERTFQISSNIYGGMGWLGRPIVLVLIVIIIISVVLAARSIAKKKKSGAKDAGEGSEKNPAISLPLSVLLLIAFIWAGYTAMPWPPIVKQFPMLICVPAAILGAWIVFQDTRHLLKLKANTGSWGETLNTARKDAWLAEAVPFFAYLAAMIVLCLIIGQKLAMPIFIGIYLIRWGGYSKRIAIVYALSAWAILVFFYGQIMSLIFHPSIVEQWTQSWFPRQFPDWLLF